MDVGEDFESSGSQAHERLHFYRACHETQRVLKTLWVYFWPLHYGEGAFESVGIFPTGDY